MTAEEKSEEDREEVLFQELLAKSSFQTTSDVGALLYILNLKTAVALMEITSQLFAISDGAPLDRGELRRLRDYITEIRRTNLNLLARLSGNKDDA